MINQYAVSRPVTYNPPLLIVGINPGGANSYSEVLKRNNWKSRPLSSLLYDVNTTTTKPQWEIDNKEKGADALRMKFKRVFNQDTGLDEHLQNAVMMNMFYYNTAKADELKDITDEAKKYCVSKTLEFIEILNPQNIVFLTSDKKLLKEATIEKKEYLANNVSKAYLNNRTIYIIPHYNYHGAYSIENGLLMGKTLSSLMK